MRTALFVTAVLASLTPPAFAADPPATPPRRKPVETLERVWPGHPEWLAMLVDILGGQDMGPNDGWFRKAVAQSRFTWPSVRDRFDGDRDGKITPDEFAGSPDDFARLDRDRDGALTASDSDFKSPPPGPNPGNMVFYRADRDGNGKVTREELDALFKSADSGGLGFLSLADLQEAFTPPRRMPTAPPEAGPSRSTLLRGLVRQEIGALRSGPALGEKAPDFTLMTAVGREEVTLSRLVGPKPVVLVFGNFTCGPFRSQAGNIEKLYRRYADRANFVMVYVREAHPTDGWVMESNGRVGVAIPQPRDFAERVGVAQTCGKTLALGFPMVVDTMDDRVGGRYSGMPSRLYVIDRDGRVAYKSGRGPFGFKPAELEHALVWQLRTDAPGLGSSEPKSAQRP